MLGGSQTTQKAINRIQHQHVLSMVPKMPSLFLLGWQYPTAGEPDALFVSKGLSSICI